MDIGEKLEDMGFDGSKISSYVVYAFCGIALLTAIAITIIGARL